MTTAVSRVKLGERAARHALAANPLIGIRRTEIARMAASLASHLARRPRLVGPHYVRLARDLVRIARGSAPFAATPGDRRFADAAWSGNAGYRRLLQSYLAIGAAVDHCLDDAGLSPRDTERAKFLASLVVDALAPTNCFAGNPAALRKVKDTRGTSVLRGIANLVDDIASGRGLPKQVDGRPYALGRNVAATRGAVVFRNDIIEVIQYAPSTPQVHARPLLIVPPQINKYYVFDLTPANSIVGAALAQGVQTFCVSFRNPTRKNASWGLDAYVMALDEAARAVRDVAGARDINVMGACSGGITLTAWLGYLAAKRTRLVHSTTLVVCVIDTDAFRDSMAGLFATPQTIRAATAASRKRGVVEGTDLARTFAWMRPNDLVWNYVVNNYLLGNDPPANEILFWNNDTTRLPATLHADFLDLFSTNAMVHPRALNVCGRKIDLSKLDVDTYVVGGMTDHITPWQGVYRTARLVGGRRATFVLSNGGHIQSLLNPPGSKRSWFMAGPARSANGERWSAKLDKNDGSWWPHWHAWLRARSGAIRPSPAALGDGRHPALDAAPGTYIAQS